MTDPRPALGAYLAPEERSGARRHMDAHAAELGRQRDDEEVLDDHFPRNGDDPYGDVPHPADGPEGGQAGDDRQHQDQADKLESWRRVDLGPALRGERTSPTPTLLRREDGTCLFYAGRVNGIHGDSGIGKTFVLLVCVTQILAGGGAVLWIDYEEPDETTVVSRLLALGADPDAIAERLVYLHPADSIEGPVLAYIAELHAEHHFALAVVDSVGEAFAVEGINEDRDNEVGPWYRMLPRPLAELGMGVVVIDHGTKAADNPLFPSGSKRKRATVSGSMFLVEELLPLTKDKGGRLKLITAKDRHGTHARKSIAGELEITVYPDGGISARLWPPTERHGDDLDTRALLFVPKVVRWVEGQRDPVTSNAITLAVKGDNTKIRAAIELAVHLGCLAQTDGPRRSNLHTFVRPFDPKADLARLRGER